jgi:hypothetical protein
LEHLPRQRVPGLLADIGAILRPGGVLRVVVPDLENIARLYLAELEAAVDGDRSAEDRHEWMTLELLDQMTRHVPGGFMGRFMSMAPPSLHNFIRARIGKESESWLGPRHHGQHGEDGIPLGRSVYQSKPTSSREEFNFRRTGEIHRWMYDRVSLARLLLDAGFSSVTVCAAAQSAIPDFASYHLDTDTSGDIRKPDSLFFEGIKPA